MQRQQLVTYLDDFLEAATFRDYCPNGLQVEGRAEVRTVVSGVTASAALIDAAIAANADAILVHHGYFWRGEDARLTGMKRARIAKLLAHDINLIAYHLPLDASLRVGNNLLLGLRLGITGCMPFGEQNLAAHGLLESPVSLAAFAARVEEKLERAPLVLGDPDRTITSIGWCTGGGQGYFEEAVARGVDLFISGEAAEQTFHIAQETGVAFIGAGHHATERFGVWALGEHLADRFGLHHRFIDLPNPI